MDSRLSDLSSSFRPPDKVEMNHAQPLKPIHTLSYQYGGRHVPGWADNLRESWIPYIELARLSPPIGLCLVLFPHVFGFLHGILLMKSSSGSADMSNLNPSRLLALAFLLVTGSLFLSNAIHGWNDLVDAPYDALVTRTRQRPVVRGAVSKANALAFTVSQAVAGAVVLVSILPDPRKIIYLVWPSVLFNLYYPFAKRQTSFAQYVLGVCLSWGVVVGTAGVLELNQTLQDEGIWRGPAGISTACLTTASALWTVVYDTIYAFQDRTDDLRIGLYSIATLFGQRAKPFLLMNLAVLTILLAYSGYLNAWSWLFFTFAVGGSVLSLGTMIVKVDLTDSYSCWWWFRYGFWFAGGSMVLGLLVECFR